MDDETYNKGVVGALSKREAGEKVRRDAFIYLPSTSETNGQCESCRDFTGDACAIMAEDVYPDSSCALYVPGAYEGQTVEKRVSPEDAGLVHRQVRCENCVYGGNDCGLFVMLNDALPDVFDLDTKIEPKGCCNAQTPKGEQ